ncbi:Wiskott-Aldrich syndrome protein [Elysia marginata]|uniref:Wiskott-Aldrich syndrome protein n=1 Tax=Elysia marginata TaxID=1093978 RepID=A0AAV4EDW9_9GAST|nr:Wiskott-Aldrich syndrome protein [Elysia marginata]
MDRQDTSIGNKAQYINITQYWVLSGTTLKHTEPGANPAPPGGGDSRDQLMDAIRQGANLKKVEASDRSSSAMTPEDNNGLVGALARALANRQKHIHGDGDRQSSSSGGAEEMGGLVGALAKALASRRPACANSDDEDDSDDDDDDDVTDDDDWD